MVFAWSKDLNNKLCISKGRKCVNALMSFHYVSMCLSYSFSIYYEGLKAPISQLHLSGALARGEMVATVDQRTSVSWTIKWLTLISESWNSTSKTSSEHWPDTQSCRTSFLSPSGHTRTKVKLTFSVYHHHQQWRIWIQRVLFSYCFEESLWCSCSNGCHSSVSAASDLPPAPPPAPSAWTAPSPSLLLVSVHHTCTTCGDGQ